MPSPFSNGVQNADAVFSLFAEGQVTLGAVAMTTSETTKEVAHGLAGTPDFILLGQVGATGASVGEGVSAELGATTITFNKVDTQASMNISYLAGNLS